MLHGYPQTHVMWHRVAPVLARDHGERVQTLTVIDICPTLKMYGSTNMAFARAYYHWFLFIQPEPVPEKMVAAVGLAGMLGRKLAMPVLAIWGLPGDRGPVASARRQRSSGPLALERDGRRPRDAPGRASPPSSPSPPWPL
jgi:hypothetical protein